MAGPPAVGKTWLLTGRDNGSMDEIGRLLDEPAITSIPAFAAGWVRPDSPDSYKTALYHLDILRQWKFGGRHIDAAVDPGFRPLAEASDLIVITLLAHPAELLRRIRERPAMSDIASVISRPRMVAGELYSHYRVRRLYSEPDRLISLYREWIATVSALSPSGHHFLDLASAPRITSFDDWADSVQTAALPPPAGASRRNGHPHVEVPET